MHRRTWSIFLILTLCANAMHSGSAPVAADEQAASEGVEVLANLLLNSDDENLQRDVLTGMTDALRGRRSTPMPKDWPAAYKKLSVSRDATVREKSRILALLFGDPAALAELRALVVDAHAPISQRRSALSALLDKKDPRLPPTLIALIEEKQLRGQAIRGLAMFDNESTPDVILKHYTSFSNEEKQDAINTLASRPNYVRELLNAIDDGDVPAADLSAFTARQILRMNDADIERRLQEVWGQVRPASEQKADLIEEYRAILTPEAMAGGDLSSGRSVFAKTCASCHMLFDAGGTIAPNLTNAARADRDYLLENILDPNALVGKDYQMTMVFVEDGRVVSGLIAEQNEQVVTIQTQTERVRLPRNEIDRMMRSTLSMMPEGLLQPLNDDQVRDLFAYLATPQQVPLPAGESKAE